MATFVSTSKFELWWRKAQAWFATQFDSVKTKIDNIDLSLFDFRSTLMGDNGTTRIRPLVAAKIVDGGTEHCGFIAQAPNENKQIIYDGVTPDSGIFFTATKSEGLLSASEGQVDSFPLGIKSGAEAFYPIADWHVCTQAPQDITSSASTWQTAVVQVGEVWRCKDEHKYYNSSEEYIGSVYVYEKVGNSEVTLGEIKAAVGNIDTSDLAKEATLGDVAEKIGTPASGQQSTLFGAIANINIDTSDLAKQGTNSSATNTAIKSAVDALSSVADAAAAYNEGKPALAQAISLKGVSASSSDSLSQMATKVSLISQQPITWDDGVISQMYQKQMFGSLTTPNYWNLYEILSYLLSDNYTRKDEGHVGEQFGGFLLAEYYKGYDSLALSGAGSGGAYVVSDIDPETGKYKVYYTDTTHTWATEDDGKGNRWVAYCFADEGHGFQIANTNTSPRSIFIGRKVGVIESVVNGRVGEIVVPDGNSLASFVTGTFTQNFGKNIILRNLGDLTGTAIYLPSNDIAKRVENIYISANKKTGYTYLINEPVTGASQTHNVILDFTNQGEDELYYLMNVGYNNSLMDVYVNTFIIKGAKLIGQFILKSAKSLGNIILEDVEKITTSNYEGVFPFCEFNKVWLPSLEEANKRGNLIYGGTPCKYLYIGYKTNDRTKTVALKNGADYSEFTDIELKDGYLKNLDIAGLTSYLTESNIVNHILNRLGDNSGQSPLTITLGATNLAKLTAEEIAIATNKGFTLA